MKEKSNESEKNEKTYLEQLQFLRDMEILNQGWNPELEKLIRDIQDKSWAYTWMHNFSVNYFSKWNDQLNIGNLGLNVITGTSTFSTLNNCSTLFWVQLSTGIVIFIAAFITGYQQYHRFQERVERHKFAASKFSALYHNIQRECGLKPHQRQNAKDYITWVTNQYDSLLLSSPEIEDSILKKYYELYNQEENKERRNPLSSYIDVLEKLPIEAIKEYQGSVPISETDDISNETQSTGVKVDKSESFKEEDKWGSVGDGTNSSDRSITDKIPVNKDDIKNKNKDDIKNGDDIKTNIKMEIMDKEDEKIKDKKVRRRKHKNRSKQKVEKRIPIKKLVLEENKNTFLSKLPEKDIKKLELAYIQSQRISPKVHIKKINGSAESLLELEKPSSFKGLKKQLMNRCRKYSYFDDHYDDNLMKYQLDRMNQVTVDKINSVRMSRDNFSDPLDEFNNL